MRLNVGRRGLWRLAPSRLRLRDALGIFERSMLAGQPEQVLILPAPDPAMPIPARPASCAAPGEADLDGLEPYVPGSPIGRIHWPALARGAGLQQRRLAPPAAGLPLVVVDTAGTSDPRAVDWAARVAAGAILRLARTGGCRVLLPGDRSATTVTGAAATWGAVHRRLALLEPVDRAAGQPPTTAGKAPLVHIHAACAPTEALVAQPRPLPPGVVAVQAGRGRD